MPLNIFNIISKIFFLVVILKVSIDYALSYLMNLSLLSKIINYSADVLAVGIILNIIYIFYKRKYNILTILLSLSTFILIFSFLSDSLFLTFATNILLIVNIIFFYILLFKKLKEENKIAVFSFITFSLVMIILNNFIYDLYIVSKINFLKSFSNFLKYKSLLFFLFNAIFIIYETIINFKKEKVNKLNFGFTLFFIIFLTIIFSLIYYINSSYAYSIIKNLYFDININFFIYVIVFDVYIFFILYYFTSEHSNYLAHVLLLYFVSFSLNPYNFFNYLLILIIYLYSHMVINLNIMNTLQISNDD